MARVASPHLQTLAFKIALKASCHPFSIGVACVQGSAIVGLQLTFSSLFTFPKYKGVI
jgi:hypothetical protein